MEAHYLKSATRRTQYPESDLPQLAFAGRSNVGKSSLINSLLGRKRLARTSSTPGRTQLINFFQVEQDYIFVDLPGYGYAKAPAHVRSGWKDMVEEFFTDNRNLKLTILLVDARHAPTALDITMAQWLQHLGVRKQIVATKTDRLSRARLKESLERMASKLNVQQVIPYSSATGTGKKKLWQIIREELNHG